METREAPAGAERQTGATVAVTVGTAATAGGFQAAASRDQLTRVLWDEHYSRLAGWCASLVGDPDVAHEIAAEAFVRLLSRWIKVRDPKGFLYVTATNLVYDRSRREARDRRLRLRLVDRGPGTAPAHDPWLRDLVQRLPERLRTPVLLHYYADMSVAEIAAALHRPTGTVKRWLAEARDSLHTSIEDQP